MEMSEIIRRAGGLVKLAKAAGRHHATILGWTRVPPQHVKAVSAATKIPAHELRPDLWDPPAAAPPPDAPQPASISASKPKRSAATTNAPPSKSKRRPAANTSSASAEAA
jgi:DNA-binding transcriptional regulator YdaS (Cro superfamily)